ncbi:glycosyltransferase family 2 protein [Mariniflexile sp. HNIBRBA6329]|uniref:glycosyltransferase family 2 protein n=1 Tax=Mariniflexile sp. HNIBRBA6329 TaxID=3373088 RepID=UPI003745E405
MQASILIVSKDRKEELEKTLLTLKGLVDLSSQEVLVFLDGCTDGSLALKESFKWVAWYESNRTIGASRARHILYAKARGTIFIGFDDDAHPLNANFVALSQQLFNEFPNVGVLAFEEIKGVFNSDEAALKLKPELIEEYVCREFVGCGFAIRKDVYEATNGFPVWVDIYGEESCLSIEVLSKGFDILYTNRITVNHRIDKVQRLQQGRNYFRFGKQLKNTAFYYIIYHRFPFVKLAKLFWHNFKKYGCSDWDYFKIYFIALFRMLIFLPQLVKYRKPVDDVILKKSSLLPNPKY